MNGNYQSEWATQIKKKGGVSQKNKEKIVAYKPFILSEQTQISQISQILLLFFTDIKVRLL